MRCASRPAILLDLGHRRIALLNGYRGRIFAEHRRDGYQTALAARGVTIDPVLCGHGEFTDEMGFRLMQGFLKLEDRPTAVVAGSMMSALGAMRAIRIAGLKRRRRYLADRPRRRFPYISPDHLVPTLSTTRSSIRAAGARIGEMVLEMLQGTPAENLREVWPVELVIRNSTAAVKKA